MWDIRVISAAAMVESFSPIPWLVDSTADSSTVIEAAPTCPST
jgi:hypothetical protein